MANYGTIYTLPFKSRLNKSYIVEIQKEGYTGRVAELAGSGDAPFSIEIADDNFLYVPIRFSTATIRVVGNDYLQSLYSTGYQQYRVNFKQGDTIVWTGFITPELYTQDYTATLFDLEIQCVSAMNTLEYADYKQKSAGSKEFVSLWELLTRCVLESRGSYSAVYIPHVYAKSLADYDANANVLQSMTISEQNFFDEDDKPMNLKEVIEELCKFLNWTCVDYKGALYFVDVDHRGNYYKYTPDFSSYTFEAGNVLSVQDIHFSGSEHTLDILGGYNKVTVKDSNYPVGNLLPEENYEDAKALSSRLNTNKDRKCYRQFLYPKNWNMYLYDGNTVIDNEDLELRAYDAHELVGGIQERYCNYKIVDGKPDISDYSFTNVIQARCLSTDGNLSMIGGLELLTKVMDFKGASSMYESGAFAISGSYKTIADSNLIPWDNSRGTYMPLAACQLRIGNKYYGSSNGLSPFTWSTDSKNFFRLPASEENNDTRLDYVSIENQKTIYMPYKGISGVIIPVDTLLYGELEFTLYASKIHNAIAINGFLLKDFSFKYGKSTEAEKTTDNTDRYYENVVNEGYINELDEIEFKISSYNNDGACYSKVMLGDNYLTDNLYSSIEQKLVRPEEHLIRRIINQYGATKFKLTQILVDDEAITPITTITDKFQPNKRFTITGGTIDFAMNQFNCKMIENGRY